MGEGLGSVDSSGDGRSPALMDFMAGVKWALDWLYGNDYISTGGLERSVLGIPRKETIRDRLVAAAAASTTRKGIEVRVIAADEERETNLAARVNELTAQVNALTVEAERKDGIIHQQAIAIKRQRETRSRAWRARNVTLGMLKTAMLDAAKQTAEADVLRATVGSLRKRCELLEDDRALTPDYEAQIAALKTQLSNAEEFGRDMRDAHADALNTIGALRKNAQRMGRDLRQSALVMWAALRLLPPNCHADDVDYDRLNLVLEDGMVLAERAAKGDT